ncbi:MAG TPA: helix-turn-helix domain-containing protein [Actinomycetota bacterium]
MLESARALFIAHGYVATTIVAIAERAGVSPETVYAVFTTKRALLSSVIDVSITGDDAPVPLLERPWVEAMRLEPEPSARLNLLATNGRRILERITPIYEVLRGAAASDPEIDTMWQRHKAQRAVGQRELIRIVCPEGSLRKGLTVDAAADLLFTIGSPETYQLLTGDRGWSPARFERWYADTLGRLLLASR